MKKTTQAALTQGFKGGTPLAGANVVNATTNRCTANKRSFGAKNHSEYGRERRLAAERPLLPTEKKKRT